MLWDCYLFIKDILLYVGPSQRVKIIMIYVLNITIVPKQFLNTFFRSRMQATMEQPESIQNKKRSINFRAEYAFFFNFSIQFTEADDLCFVFGLALKNKIHNKSDCKIYT
jgi:hypothetical protein